MIRKIVLLLGMMALAACAAEHPGHYGHDSGVRVGHSKDHCPASARRMGHC